MSLAALADAPTRPAPPTPVAHNPTADLLALRALVRTAMQTVPVQWPLSQFIATNPVARFEHLPFAQGATEGATLFGGRAFLPAAEYRAAFAAGRLPEALLRAVFARHAPATPRLMFGGAAIDGADLLWRALTVGLAAADLPAGARVPEAARALAARAAATPAPAAAWDPTRETRAAFLDRTAGGSRLGEVNVLLARYSTAYLDRGQAAAAMPGREGGFFRALAGLAPHDPALKDWPALSHEPDAALLALLRATGLPVGAWAGLLACHVAALPGIAGLFRFHAEHGDGGADPVDLLAARLAIESAICAGAAPASKPVVRAPVGDIARRLGRIAAVLGLPESTLAAASVEETRALLDALDAFPETAQGLIWLTASEAQYRAPLAAALAARGATAAREPAEAQIVFCIDVRSEVLRRAVEAEGGIETFGFAGFFGLAVRLTGFSDEALDLCPVLLRPKQEVRARKSPRATYLRSIARSAAATWAGLKGSPASPFALVEAVGAFFLAPLALASLAPRLFAEKPPVPTETDVLEVLTLDEQVFQAQAALSIMGLTKDFGRVVVFSGHGGETRNNPYAAALDCGACGGRRGGPSAAMLADICNRKAVRAKLAEIGIHVPDDTWFLAAEHNTTTDELVLFGTDRAPASHREAVASLKAKLLRARNRAANERLKRLPAGGTIWEEAATRAAHWAETRPEWGLARNAAFIVGPRGWTAGLDLEGRTFLHSYDPAADADASALEIILTAPMVVAQWINSQYYFSTVDNVAFGSGDKVLHNVAAQTGVALGNGGDIRAGLAWQSVMGADGKPYHEPLRLMTAVLAPPDRVANIIARNPILQRLFGNEWVALLVVDPATGETHTWNVAEQALLPGVPVAADPALAA